MQPFRKDYRVDVHDLDYNGVCRVSALQRFMQSAAEAQLTENGLSYNTLKNEYKRAFIVSRMKMTFDESPTVFQTVSAETFPCPSRGYSFLRCYRLFREDTVIGRAISLWALIDTDEHTLLPVRSFDLPLELFDAIDLPLPRFKLPDNMLEVGTYTVNYADLDQNGHMNNTHYPDMYANFLDLDSRRIDEISINFIHEARGGERLRVLRAEKDGFFYFKTLRADGSVNTEAEVHTVRI